MSAYRARVPHAHNLPWLEAPARGTTKDRIKTPHKGKCGRTEKNPIKWYHDFINVIFKLDYYQVNLDNKITQAIICHDHATTRHAKHITQSDGSTSSIFLTCTTHHQTLLVLRHLLLSCIILVNLSFI